MKIGIIIHSQTGHTYSVAEKLQDEIFGAGHEVNIERVNMVGGDRPESKEKVQIESPPDVGVYEALIFGAPVHAFNLAPAMQVYLEQIPSIQDKKVALFVTKNWRFNWTGGNQAINKMKKLSESKGGTVIGTGIIAWNKQQDEKIAELVQEFSGLF